MFSFVDNICLGCNSVTNISHNVIKKVSSKRYFIILKIDYISSIIKEYKMDELKTIYNFSNAELGIITGNVVVAMNRDAAEFLQRGIDQIAIEFI